MTAGEITLALTGLGLWIGGGLLLLGLAGLGVYYLIDRAQERTQQIALADPGDPDTWLLELVDDTRVDSRGAST